MLAESVPLYAEPCVAVTGFSDVPVMLFITVYVFCRAEPVTVKFPVTLAAVMVSAPVVPL